MSGESEPLENLVDHAARTHVVVVGGGIAGLVAAFECAKVGLRVTLLEAAATLGGTIRSGEVDGVVLDLGVDGFATAGGHVTRLLDELDLSGLMSEEAPGGVWTAGSKGVSPLPAETVLGIPANPWDPAVRRMIGWRGVWRAYLDRLRPPLTIGQQHNLDRLVRGRMGDRVVDLMVAPLTVGRHGLRPDEVDVDVAAPGLNSALTRTGSLSGGVAQLRAASAEEDRPAYATLAGGMAQLVGALHARLQSLDAEILTEARVLGIDRSEGAWQVAQEGAEPLAADVVIIACDEDAARRLLARHVAAIDEDATASQALDVVTMLVDATAVSAARLGAIYPVPGSSPARSATRPSARWPWLAERLASAPEGPLETVRVILPAGVPDADPIATAVAAASALLGVPLPKAAVRGGRRDRFASALPSSAIGHAADAERARAAVAGVPGLAVTGGWLSGSGLARVIPDAVAEAERVRRIVLFGPESRE